jgi:hypothetical protein
MSRGEIAAVVITGVFVTVTLGLALLYSGDFPALAVASETSVGTWLSGVLLSCCAGISLVYCLRYDWYRWAIIVTFFLLLAADEHFMFHERMKEWITFSYTGATKLVRESPVIAGAVLGGWIVRLLWNELSREGRIILSVATLCGILSVTLDVMGGAALVEECLKIVGELGVLWVLMKVNKSDHQM